MEKFNKTFRGYNPREVNAFLDEVIGYIEKMVANRDEDNQKMIALRNANEKLEEQVNRYKMIETTLNKTIVAAQDNSEHIRKIAKQESTLIVNEARRNANLIINEALLRAEKIEFEADKMKKNVTSFKRKLRSTIEAQLEMVDDIEILDI